MEFECQNCGKRCEGFLTDREQRKVCGIGILYVLGFPILILMIGVGVLKANAPGEENPNCPAEPNMPWFLVLGGVGITALLLVRIVLNKTLRRIVRHAAMMLLAASVSLVVILFTTSWPWCSS